MVGGLVVNATTQPHFTPGKDPVPIVQEGGWAPGPVWTGEENLTPIGIRSPDRPARSQSLYRLSYPDLHSLVYVYTHTHTHTHIYIYIYIIMFVNFQLEFRCGS